MEISDRTQNEYYQKLVTLRLDVLNQAIEQLIDEWDKPHMMPPVAVVLEYVHRAQQRGPLLIDARRILDRGEKPPDWEPLDAEQFATMLGEAKEKVSFPVVTAEDFAAERNGATKVPADPIARKAWATQRAKEAGWL